MSSIELNKMMRCPECGHLVPSDATICPYCKTNISELTTVDNNGFSFNRKTLYWILGVILGLAVVGSAASLLTRKNGGSSADRTEAAGIDSLAGNIVSELEPDEIYSTDDSPRSFALVDMPMGGDFASDLAAMACNGGFAGAWQGMTVGDMGDVAFRGKAVGQQFKFDNGYYKLQFFFDGSAKSNSSTITGIALSVDPEYFGSDIYTAVSDFEAAMEANGYSTYSRSYSLSDGACVSAGYSGSKFYIYYYFSNARSKDPAPRK